MNFSPATFWTWFAGFAKRIPNGDPPEELLDELLEQLHRYDERIYFELSTNTATKELILTASGEISAFETIDQFVAAAPSMEGWTFIALKPALGFDFTHRDNEIELKASDLWFLPLKSESQPQALGLRLGVPDADFVMDQQSVDTAYTILETGIGERSCGLDIEYVEIDDLPEDPSTAGYFQLPKLAKYIEWHKLKYAE